VLLVLGQPPSNTAPCGALFDFLDVAFLAHQAGFGINPEHCAGANGGNPHATLEDLDAAPNVIAQDEHGLATNELQHARQLDCVHLFLQ